MYIIQDRDQKSSDSVPVGQLTLGSCRGRLRYPWKTCSTSLMV